VHKKIAYSLCWNFLTSRESKSERKNMDSRRSTAVQFFVEDDNNKVSCTSVTSCTLRGDLSIGVSRFNIRVFY
jgi:hypothetical protein